MLTWDGSPVSHSEGAAACQEEGFVAETGGQAPESPGPGPAWERNA